MSKWPGVHIEKKIVVDAWSHLAFEEIACRCMESSVDVLGHLAFEKFAVDALCHLVSEKSWL